MLGFCCCSGFSLVVANGDYSVGTGHGFLIVLASLAAEHRLWHVGFSGGGMHSLGCSARASL